jgi:hypothetical protein
MQLWEPGVSVNNAAPCQLGCSGFSSEESGGKLIGNNPTEQFDCLHKAVRHKAGKHRSIAGKVQSNRCHIQALLRNLLPRMIAIPLFPATFTIHQFNF